MTLACFLSWLHEWQDLAAGLIGAFFLIITVRWTLGAERRRRSEETKSLRVALGAEVRQFAGRAFTAYQEIMNLAKSARVVQDDLMTITVRQVDNACSFVSPVIYPNTAHDLGSVGAHAHKIVYFFGQVEFAQDAVRRLTARGDIDRILSRLQILNIVEALLNAAETAAGALPAFSERTWSNNDADFYLQVKSARQDFDKFKGSRPEAAAGKL